MAPSGPYYLNFNGDGDYVEVPGSADFSVDTNQALSIAAWIRPDVLNFLRFEGSHYVHWLGKGEGSGDLGQQEWTFRMYNRDGTTEQPPRPNRISFYVFNPTGRLGVGSFFQDEVVVQEWIYIAGIADNGVTRIYKNGVLRHCDQYQDLPDSGCEPHNIPGTQDRLFIQPQAGNAPMRFGTRDFKSFFAGGLAEIRIWGRPLSAGEIRDSYESGTIPQDALVAEYLLNEGAGVIAHDSTGNHDGTIVGAAWKAMT